MYIYIYIYIYIHTYRHTYKGKQRVCVRARALSRVLCLMFALANTKNLFCCLCTHPYISAYICPLPRTRPRTRTRRCQQFRTSSFRLMSAPAASSAVTTSMWPLRAAMWRAVHPSCKQQAAREGKQECVRVCARVCVCVCVCV